MSSTLIKTALILGVSGQDGAYLAQHLMDCGYRVIGSSRDATSNSFHNLATLGIRDRVEKISINHTDFRSVLQGITSCEPQEIYNLGGQSSVGLSFQQPVETIDSIVVGTINLLEAVRYIGADIRVYQAGSSEVFGNTEGQAASETTPFNPRSPYATAKAAAHWTVVNYREAYGLHASSGVLFNHESPLRPPRFVTKKIVRGALRIAREGGSLSLGELSIRRDWGWAPEYVRAMHLMLQRETPRDYVIASGRSHSLREFCDWAFQEVGLDYRDHVREDQSFSRPSDVTLSQGDAGRAERELGWSAETELREIIRRMIRAEQAAEGPAAGSAVS